MIRMLIILACLAIAPGMAFAANLTDAILESQPDTVATVADRGVALHVTGPVFVAEPRLMAHEPQEKHMDPFAQADLDIFDAMSTAETYTAPGKSAIPAKVIFERGVVTESPDRKTRVVDNTLLAHLLVSEVGRPVRGATISDGAEKHKVDGIQSDDKSVVVCRMV